MEIDMIHFEKQGLGRESCQDVFYSAQTDRNTILCLADGVSSRRYGGLGALTVERELTRMFQMLGDLRDITERELRMHICYTIRENLGRLSQEKGCDLKEFASTLMMVILPKEEDFMWVVHIGDGVIANLSEDGTLHIVSHPHYGVLKQYTYSTVDADLYREIRIRRLSLDGWILAMTDGITEEIFDERYEIRKEYGIIIKNADWEGLESCLRALPLRDDIGFCAVKAEANGHGRNGYGERIDNEDH